MDILDLMALSGQLPQQGTSEMPDVSPITGMMYPQTENPFTPMGLVGLTRTVKSGSGAQPMTQADFLQKQLAAMQAQGLAQQQQGVEAYQKQLADLTQAQQANPWQVAVAGLSDLFAGSKNLDKLQQQQLMNKQLALAGTEKVQKAKNDITENQTALIKAQLDYEKAREKNASDEERWKALFGIQKQKLDKKDFTPGQEAADKKFGQEYQEWNQQGGYAAVEENLKALEDAAKALETDPTLTGGDLEKFVPGGTTDVVRSRVKPDSFNIQQKVDKAVQASLRQTLGAQFTEKEGQQVMARTFDARLPGNVIAERIRSEANKIRATAQQKDAASKYFEQHGTLVGQGAAQSKGSTTGLTADQEKRRQELLKKKSGGK